MSKQSSDQRSYSVDEMMARLRDGERDKRDQDEGELVTREDGTQVVRVRRRKRRSKQPEAEARKRKKRSLKFIIPLVIGLLVLVGVAVILLVAKFNSRGYQDKLESGLEDYMGSKLSIERLVVTPIKLRAASFRSEWPEGGMLENLELSALEGDLELSGFVGGALKGEEIMATRGRIQLGSGTAGMPLVRGPEAAFFLDYERLRCRFFDVRFGGEEDAGILLKNSEATLLMADEVPNQVHLRGGELVFAGWEPLIVDRGMGQVTGGGFEIISLHASPKESLGELTLTTAAPVISGRSVQLNLEIANFPLDHLVGNGFDAMFSGSVSSSAGSIVFTNEDIPRSDLRVEFSGRQVGLARLPFLENLRTMFGDTDYVRPEFDSIRGVFRRSGGGALVQGLVLESKGQMVVRGSMELSPTGELSGNLEVGIPESKVITATGRKRNEVFSDPKGGYCWVMLELSGDAEDPEDNFKILLQKAAKKVFEERKHRPAGDRFEELIQPR